MQKKPTACHATGHTTGSGAGNEGMNFCVNMVECPVGMGVSMLPLSEGRVPCSTQILSLPFDFMSTLGFGFHIYGTPKNNKEHLRCLIK